jgi:prepilin-type N-terminal cleavage/methylation domain-containing protein
MGMKTMTMTARFKTNAGLTLTEMMVVVAIIGILTAFAIPEYLVWNSKAKLRDATALVAGNINLARVGAINQGTSVTVTVCYQTATCPAAPLATVNPAPSRVTVFFKNSTTGRDLMPVLTLDSLIALTDASNGAVASPQDVQFSQVGIRQFIGTNANNLCVTNTGAYTACAGGNAQVFNFRNTDRNLNYRTVIAPSGKATWCYTPTCAGQ